MPEPVIVVDYDPRWPLEYERLRARASAALGDLAIAIEHVGSTAVPGLAAKAIIDMIIVIADDADLPQAIERLGRIGYVYEGDLGVPDRYAFMWPQGETRHHLYVCPRHCREIQRHIVFRDALRRDATLVEAYAELKRTAAERLRDEAANSLSKQK